MRILTALLLAGAATPALAHVPDLSVPFSAPSNYTAHARLFQERVTHVGKTPVWQIEFQGMNIVVVEGSDGLIILDTGMNRDVATAALAKIRAQISTKPIKAIIYTHHHPDHAKQQVPPQGAGQSMTAIWRDWCVCCSF